jgi:hypothetical protein
MGFTKRTISVVHTYNSLRHNNLSLLYSKIDSFLFEDEISSKVYKLYREGKTEKEIITLLNIEI